MAADPVGLGTALSVESGRKCHVPCWVEQCRIVKTDQGFQTDYECNTERTFYVYVIFFKFAFRHLLDLKNIDARETSYNYACTTLKNKIESHKRGRDYRFLRIQHTTVYIL